MYPPPNHNAATCGCRRCLKARHAQSFCDLLDYSGNGDLRWTIACKCGHFEVFDRSLSVVTRLHDEHAGRNAFTGTVKLGLAMQEV